MAFNRLWGRASIPKIGVIGAVYTFGFVGLILFGWQYWFGVRAVKGLPPERNTAFLDASKGFLLYTVIGSTIFIYHAATTLFFVMLICYMTDARGLSQRIATCAE